MAQGTKFSTWIELLREEATDELRVISYQVLPSKTEICEQTDGENTMLAFGTLSRRQTISLDQDNARSLIALLAQEAPGADLDEALHSFFSEGAYLSDLQDLLDTAQIAYAYSVVSGAYAAFRKQDE